MTPFSKADRRKRVEVLRELTRALDRRVPHVDRAGEKEIAADAAALKAKANRQIADLESRTLEPDTLGASLENPATSGDTDVQRCRREGTIRTVNARR